MATEHTAEWITKLIERGEDVGHCLAFIKEIAEKEEKMQREMKGELKES